MTSKRLQEYIEADKKVKEAEAIKESHKAYVQKLLRRCKKQNIKISNISISKANKFSIDEDSLYIYLTEILSEGDLENLTRKTVDLKKLQDAVLDDKIDSTKFPKTVYSSKEYYTVRVNHKKER